MYPQSVKDLNVVAIMEGNQSYKPCQSKCWDPSDPAKPSTHAGMEQRR